MKKYFLKITALVLFIGTLVSCTQDKIFYNESKYPALASFNTTSGGFAVTPKVTTHTIPVVVSNKSSVVRTIKISLDASNLADTTKYHIQNASLVIPANSYEGDILIHTTYDASLINTAHTTLVLNLEMVGGSADPADGVLLETTKKQFSLDIFTTCDLDPSKIVGGKGNTTAQTGPYKNVVTTKTGSDTPIPAVPTFYPTVVVVSKPTTASPKNPTTISVSTLWGENYYATVVGNSNFAGQNLEAGTITINDDFSLTITPSNPQSNIKAASGTYDTCTNTFTYTLNIAQIYDGVDNPVDPHVATIVMTLNQ